VQKMLGHSSAKMALDTYTHLFDDELGGVAERFAPPPPGLRQAPGQTQAEFIDLRNAVRLGETLEPPVAQKC
jgi:hypothetical protein